MRNIIIALALVVFVLASCKKNQNNVSTEVTYSAPIISFAGGNIYYSIPIGGALPAISASAYDTVYKESDSVLLDQSSLDNTTPGLYIVTASAKNKYGMTSYASVYVAVTDINPAINLAGQYIRTSNSDTVQISKLANGLYQTSNVAGTTNVAYIVPAVFVQVDDTTIILPNQQTAQGALYGGNTGINMSPLDTTITYSIQGNPAYSTAVRQFLKL